MITPTRVDPITLEVLRNALPAITNEMSLDLQRSSYNMMIYEVRDYSCALLAADGSLIAQNMGGVSHFVSDLGVVIRDGMSRFGPGGFAPGDVILTNHQAVAGQHLNNIVVYTPIFVDDRLYAFGAIRAHWIDVGGMSTGFGAGSLSHDPWAEGLQLDQVKVWDAGVPDQKVLKLIRDNIRFPDSSMGDLRSQVAACRLAERRLRDLHARYGTEVVDSAIQTTFSRTEEKCRRAVGEISDGVYEAASLLDGDSADPRPLEIKVRLTVSGGEMEIDLSGCSPQRASAVNSRTYAGALVAYKALTAPEDPVNEGSFAAVRVVIPEGNVMMARYPAPMSGWSTILPTVADTVFRALADAIPDRVAAGHFGILGIPVVFFGVDPETGRRFVSQSIEGGGWGGRPFEDGESASVSICQGDVRNAPIENIELKVPMLVEERRLLPDSGGPGRYRGGLGIAIRLRSLAEGRWNLNQSRRREMPAWGLLGGRPGGTPDNLIRRPTDQGFTSIDAAQVQAPAGTVVIQTSAGGGGWGDPCDREPAQVARDVREGYVSAEAAEREYRVVLAANGQGVDEGATRRLRAEREKPDEAHTEQRPEVDGDVGT
jgi:N-methylhydantoinase B